MLKIKEFVFIFFLFSIALCQKQKSSSSATVAKRGKYPFVVSIEVKGKSEKPVCTGSLLNPRVVVTTAFCIGKNWTNVIGKLSVTAGSQYLPTTKRNGTQQRKVMGRVQHPNYKEEYFYNDIALLLLWEPFNTKRKLNIQTIGLNSKRLADGYPCESIGWGLQNIGANSNQSNIPLRSVKVHLFNPEFCEFMFHIQIAPGQACVERPSLYADVCTVDIGSPLVCDNKLVGVASKVANCTNIQEPNVYTLVTYYNGFIHYTVDPLELERCSSLKPTWIICVIGNFVTECLFLMFKML